jgi:transmembrane sensor
MEQERAVPLPDSVRADAAAWVARLHGSGRSRALEAALRKWLMAHPDHARAFEIATEAWEIGGSVRGAPLSHTAVPFTTAPRSVAARYLAMAAALFVMLVGTAVFLNQRPPPISTAVGEQSMLTMDDGSRIYLNTDTRLFVQENAAQRRVRLESGEAWFDVVKDARRPFVVTAGDQVVVALGTAFVIRRDARQLSVTLIEGKVAVSPAAEAAAAERLLAPGQRLTFVDREPPELDEPAIDNLTAWRRGEVILDKTQLRDAVAEMNRYSAVQLVVNAPETADILISGIFRAGDSARFAQAVSATYGLQLAQEPQRILLSGPPARD